MTLLERYLNYLSQICEGSRTPPEGILLTRTGDMEKAIELQQIAGLGIPEFVKRCAAQDGEEIPEQELESFDASQMLSALTQMDAGEALPAQEAPASGESGDDEIFYQLMESYKNRLTPDKRAFIGMAQGDVKDDLLTVYCSTEVQKSMLDQKVVTDVLSEVTSRAVGREIRVRFLVGERPGAKKRDKMQDLLRMGSKFDNFTVK